MAESNISEDLFEAKRDVLQDQRQAINKAKKSKGKKEVNEMRRSGRIKQKEDKCNELVYENFGDEVTTNYDDKIDVPDSDEVGTKVVPNNLNIKLEIKVEILTEEESKNYVTHDSDSAVSVNTSDVDSTAVIEQLLAELIERSVPTLTTHRLRRFNCEKCKYSAIDSYHLKRHLASMHTEIQIKCLICDSIFSEKFNYNTHLPNCYYKCPYLGCNKKFKIDYKFSAHKRGHINLLKRLV